MSNEKIIKISEVEDFQQNFNNVIDLLFPNEVRNSIFTKARVDEYRQQLRTGILYNRQIYNIGIGIDVAKLREMVVRILYKLKNSRIVKELPKDAAVNNLLALGATDQFQEDDKEFLNTVQTIDQPAETVYILYNNQYYAVPQYLFRTNITFNELGEMENTLQIADNENLVLGITLQFTHLMAYIGMTEMNDITLQYGNYIIPTTEEYRTLSELYFTQRQAEYKARKKQSEEFSKRKKIKDSPRPPPERIAREIIDSVIDEALYTATEQQVLNQILNEHLDNLTLEVMIEYLVEEVTILRSVESVQERLIITNPELNLQFRIVDEDIYVGNDDDDDMMRGPQDDLSQAVRDYARAARDNNNGANNQRELNNAYNRLANIIRDRMGDYRIGDVEYQFLVNAVETALSVPRGWLNVINFNSYIGMLRDPRPQLFQIDAALRSMIDLLDTIPIVIKGGLAVALTKAFVIKIMYYTGYLFSPIEQPVETEKLGIIIDTRNNWAVTEDTVSLDSVERMRILPRPVTQKSIIDVITNPHQAKENIKTVADPENNALPPLDKPLDDTVEFNKFLYDNIEKVVEKTINKVNMSKSYEWDRPILEYSDAIPWVQNNLNRPTYPKSYESDRPNITKVLEYSNRNSYTPAYVPDPGFVNTARVIVNTATTDFPSDEQIQIFAEQYKKDLELNKDVLLNFINQDDWRYQGPPLDDEDDEDFDFDIAINKTRDPDDIPKLVDDVGGFMYILKTVTYWIASSAYQSVIFTSNQAILYVEKIVTLSMNCALAIINSMNLKAKIAAIATSLYLGTVISQEGIEGIQTRVANTLDFIDTNISNVSGVISSGSGIASNLAGVIKNVTDSVLSFTATGLGAGLILIIVGGLVYTLATGGLKFSVF